MVIIEIGSLAVDGNTICKEKNEARKGKGFQGDIALEIQNRWQIRDYSGSLETGS